MANRKSSIQEQTFRVETAMRNITPERVIKAVTDYLPSSVVSKEGDGRQTVHDHLDRAWEVAACEGGEICVLSTPLLAYQDLDEYLYLLQELGKAGAEGGEGCGVRLFVSAQSWPERAVQNLGNIVSSRLPLLASALQAPEWSGTELEPKRPDDEGAVEIFPTAVARELEPDEVKACIQLSLAIGAQASGQKWASADPVASENERYACRCWFLRMGLIGEEYKMCRSRLLKRLPGDGSFKSGRPSKAASSA